MKRLSLIVARTRKGLTQKEIAEKIGLSQQIYSRYENKKATPSSFKIMNQISEIVEIPKEYLFNDIFNKKGCGSCGVCLFDCKRFGKGAKNI